MFSSVANCKDLYSPNGILAGEVVGKNGRFFLLVLSFKTSKINSFFSFFNLKFGVNGSLKSSND